MVLPVITHVPPFVLAPSSLFSSSKLGLIRLHRKMIDASLNSSTPPAASPSNCLLESHPLPSAPQLKKDKEQATDLLVVATDHHHRHPRPPLSIQSSTKMQPPFQQTLMHRGHSDSTLVTVANMPRMDVPAPITVETSIAGSSVASAVSASATSSYMAQQLKRKRGRPRKYALDLFPSHIQFSSTSPGIRLSLASKNTFTTIQPNLLPGPRPPPTAAGKVTSKPLDPAVPAVKPPPPKKRRKRTPPKPQLGVSGVKEVWETNAPLPEDTNTLAASSSPSPLQSADGSPSGSVVSTQTVSSPFLPSMHSPSIVSNTATTATTPTTATPEVINDTLFTGGATPSTLLLMSPTTQMPALVNLIGRLLPQTEAAVSAARVAGLPGPHAWTTQVVADFVASLPGCQNLAPIFIEHASAIEYPSAVAAHMPPILWDERALEICLHN